MLPRPQETQTIGAAPGIPSRVRETQPLTGFTRRFGDLRVRPKLMVLHNALFLMLAASISFAILGVVEGRLDQARTRETTLILNAFSSFQPESGTSELRPYSFTSGSAGELGLSDESQAWMRRFPGRVWQSSPSSEHLFKFLPGPDRFARITLPLAFYASMIRSVRLALFAALGIVYVFFVLILELLVLPRYVYQPIRLLLDADTATRRGDRASEIIPEPYIPGDEVGRILRSHNQTVRALRQHEDELEAAKRSLEAQDRLVSLGLLSASVAHEMNTPLAVLHGSIEKLLECAPEPPARSRLERMLRVTERLRRISTSLLDFARQRRIALERVDLRAVIDEAWHMVAIDEKAADVEFRNHVPTGAIVLGNPDRLVQVFVNLLRNAMLAAPATGGLVEASATEAANHGRLSHSIRIDDNGPGIPPEILPDVFEAFVTTRLDSRGTGLGLTVVEGIVHQHGGAITASNRADGGARLEVLLPAAEQDPA